MASFSLFHIPPLLIATSLTIGGMMPFWNPEGAIRAFGLPDRIAVSKPAQSCFTVYSSRATVHGAAIWILYLRGNLSAVDTLLSVLIYATAIDGYVCWKEGVRGSAVFRMTAGFIVSGWGLFNLTSR
jgi:hypothetical protein